ncbi:uncharacterized protein CG3556 [Parasteatoda tepidariorum]|uniref:uncharacterized protein CG3556 n=1 Tax=Parasteatoda tepidariorum TaxID=114398 RepID=UPI001C71AE10|nr:uncharacterized protein CG3556 [Parasteatoda tepidariorum]
MIRYILMLFTLGFTTAKGEFVSTLSCKSNEFQCFNGQCIKRNQWCDKTTDCREDKSDERFCSRGTFPNEDPNQCRLEPLLFLCRDGTCIPIVGRCDKAYDCPDNSDEMNCSVNSYRNNNVLPEPVKAQRIQNRPSYNYRYLEGSSYTDLPYENFKLQLSSARDWIKSQQEKNYGWGDYTARAVISMYLSRVNVFPKSEEDLLMDKQLDIELFVALRRNETNTLSLCELALYINALLAACKNPRNFYGYNLVSILRERADKVNLMTRFVSPLVHLTLCLSNTTEPRDVKSLQEILTANQSIVNKVDIISLAVLASSCIIRDERYSHPQFRRRFANLLLNKINDSGLPGNIYELSLAMQALNAAEVDPLEWGRDVAIESILRKQTENGSFGDVLGTYYTIPVLSGKSLLSLSNHCGQDFSNGKTPLDVLKNTKERKISVTYTLHFGDPMEMSQKITLQVAEGTNFLDVMRLAEEENPNFRFSLDETKDIPFVYSIGGVPNDAERGLYWTLYVQNTRNPSDYILSGRNIEDLIPINGEEIRFCQKQI